MVFVFQFYNLVAGLTARENVSLVTEIANHPMKPDEALELVGLGERVKHFPAQLSGGEQQRVAVARAHRQGDHRSCSATNQPARWTSATGIHVLEALDRVNRELSTTMLIITHNVGIGDIADRVLRMQDGEIIEETKPNRRLKPAEISW